MTFPIRWDTKGPWLTEVQSIRLGVDRGCAGMNHRGSEVLRCEHTSTRGVSSWPKPHSTTRGCASFYRSELSAPLLAPTPRLHIHRLRGDQHPSAAPPPPPPPERRDAERLDRAVHRRLASSSWHMYLNTAGSYLRNCRASHLLFGRVRDGGITRCVSARLRSVTLRRHSGWQRRPGTWIAALSEPTAVVCCPRELAPPAPREPATPARAAPPADVTTETSTQTKNPMCVKMIWRHININLY